MDIIVEKYPTPIPARGFDWMAHSEAIEAAGIYGFGATEQEAAHSFALQLAAETVPADEHHYPAGCPDPDWCRGNRACYWKCNEAAE